MDMRGLANFIQDIRKATSNRDEEQKRIDVELSKIRSKFRESGKLSAYDRKKYVCKLMFIAMLGYTVDFGHMEGVQLLSGESSSEKLIGYLSISVFLNENHELLTLTTHTVHLDLLSGKEFNTCLALTAIGNTGGKDFAEAMSHGVEKLILGKVSPHVRKKAMLAMLRLYRKYRDAVDLTKIVPKIVDHITDTNMGVANCAVAFIQGILDSSDDISGLLSQVPSNCVAVLERIIMHKTTEVDYIYYSVPAPWLQAKLLRLLQYFPRPDSSLVERSTRILEKIQSATERVLSDAQTHQRQRGTQNRCNAMNAVLAEVISLTIQWDCRSLLDPCQKILKTFAKDRKESNLRYLGLFLTTRMSFCQGFESRFASHIEDIQQEIFLALEDPDISIRKKALELLYNTCTPQTARDIIDRFIEYIAHAEQSFRDDLVLVIAVLAEKFCTDNTWYCETILSLLQHAGDSVPKEIWHRLIHVVVDSPSIHKRLTEASFSAIQSRVVPEVVVNVAALLLGEFGYTIAVNAGSEPIAQVNTLNLFLPSVSPSCKCNILSALCKLYNVYAVPAVRERIIKIFEQYRGNMHPEIQQRAVEYLTLVTTLTDDVLQQVMEPLPPFNKSSRVMSHLLSSQRGADRDVWLERARERDERQAAVSAAMRGAGFAAAAPAMTVSQGAQAPIAPKQPLASKADLDSTFDRIAPSASPAQHIPNEGDSRQYFMRLAHATDSKGFLYTSDWLNIGITQEYRGADGRLTMTIQNARDCALEKFSLEIVSTPPNLVLQSKAIPNRLDAKASSNILFACRCLGGFSDYPSIAITWEGGPIIRVKLPIGVQKFISPYPIASQTDFEVLWGNTQSGNNTLATVPMEFPLNCSREDLVSLLSKIGFSASVDGRGRIYAAASFASMPQQAVFQPFLVHIATEGSGKGALLVKCPSAELQMAVIALLTGNA